MTRLIKIAIGIFAVSATGAYAAVPGAVASACCAIGACCGLGCC